MENEQELKKTANRIRQDIIAMLTEAGSGHSGGPLGATDIATALYFSVMNVDPKKPDDPDRDRLYISAGHYAPVWYATLARAGFFPVDELKTLRKLGTRLQGHVDRVTVPGIDSSAASLGQGLSIACGSAMAARFDNKKYYTYAFLSDGEHDEGSTWEAVAFAGHYKLGNLTAILDRNNIQIEGNTEDVMTKESLREKYEGNNWHVIEVDGNNIEELVTACNEAKAIVEAPVCIIAHTIPGKGVSFMEKDYTWHGKPPKGEESEQAMKELKEEAKNL